MNKRIIQAIESSIYTSCEHKMMFSHCERGFEFTPNHLIELPTQSSHSVWSDDDGIEIEYTLLSVVRTDGKHIAVYDMRKI
jgi:hypothetical protein